MDAVDLCIGTVPIYEAGVVTLNKNREIIDMDPDDIFKAIENQAKEGVDFMTLHCGITKDLVEKLKSGDLDVILGNRICQEAFSKEALLSRPMFESINYLVADQSIAEKYPPGDAAAILQGECLVTNCENEGPNSIEMLQEMLQREFGVIPERISQTNTANTQLLMVRATDKKRSTPSTNLWRRGATT